MKRLPVVAACLLLALSGCTAVDPARTVAASSALAPGTPATPSPVAAPTTTAPAPTPTVTPLTTNPFTGTGAVPTGPVIAVKIDDTGNGRPQRGIDDADVVYLEQAEGGLSRLAAVFASNLVDVEPVRSVRASDAELLSQYGSPALADSGGGGDSLATVRASTVIDADVDVMPPSTYRRDSGRSIPYNMVVDLPALAAALAGRGVSTVRDIGFRFGAPTSAPSGPAGTVSTTVGSTPVGFVWDAGLAAYVRVINGSRQRDRAGNPVTASTVVVQQCQVHDDFTDVDVNGHPSQYTQTVGTGAVTVFRDGTRYDGTWSRASAAAPTTFTAAGGTALTFATGRPWVVLVTVGTAVTAG